MKYISITFLHDHSVTAGWREKKQKTKNKKQDVARYPHSNGFLESSLGAPRYSRDRNLAFKETASYGEEGTTEDTLLCTVSSIALITITLLNSFVGFVSCDPHPGM